MSEFNRSASSKRMRNIVALGKKYSKTAFPNPTRKGCPSRSSLRAMANRDRRLTLKDLPVSHVVSCSNCFQEYTRFRRMSILVRGIKITAAAVVILAAALAAGRFALNYTSRRGEPSISHKQRTAPESPVASKQRPPIIAPLPIQIDLASFSPTRGDDTKDDSRHAIHLQQKLLRANLLLPVGLEPGEYAIRLQDSEGTVVIDKPAVGHMKDGITSVEVDIDLIDARRGNFTLMIRPPGLSWRRFPVVIE
jgi:hypothetical protein